MTPQERELFKSMAIGVRELLMASAAEAYAAKETGSGALRSKLAYNLTLALAEFDQRAADICQDQFSPGPSANEIWKQRDWVRGPNTHWVKAFGGAVWCSCGFDKALPEIRAGKYLNFECPGCGSRSHAFADVDGADLMTFKKSPNMAAKS